ncbi:toll/interleukin-1 receptor domain-containing protein [Streptomyces sp. S1D4-11]|nr:toll/interleukin-1 receptor domain-containing protein [Streptomyces sp. S1D4-11]QIY94529.1 TIR domain-containing protein [Streptomyces sp. S1D4-11]
MKYFVSYARRDNSPEHLQEISSFLGQTGRVYIDDLEIHDHGADRVRIVVDALAEADVFIAVQSRNYLSTEWTKWELAKALHDKIEVMALLPNWEFARWGTRQWPWPVNYVHARAISAPSMQPTLP